jgi:hypothetical protein
MKKHMLKYLSSIHLYSPRLDRAGSDSPLGLKPEQAAYLVFCRVPSVKIGVGAEWNYSGRGLMAGE